MKRTKTSAKKNTQEEVSSQREKQRPKKWDKSDTTHYNNMKKVVVPATQLACPETMTKLGIKSDIEGLFQNMGLGQLCNLNEPTYPDHPDDSHQEGFLASIVQKVYFEVSFTYLCGLFGLSAGERTSGLYWTSELLNFWETIGTGVYRSSQAKESLIRNPVLRYATRLIGSLLYGTTTAASVTQWELCLLYQGVRHLLPAFGNSTFPPAIAFNMGVVLAANLAGYKGKVALDRSNNIAWNYLDVISLVSKEFIAGPHSRIDRDGPYVYVFQDRAKKTLYCHLPQIGLTALLSEAAVEFLPPATALVDKPSFFTPKYQTKGNAVDDEEGEYEAAQAIPDDSQHHQLLPSDSSQPCHCQKDDLVHRDNSPSSCGSGSSGTRRARKRSKRPEDAETSGAGNEE
uniref:Arabidopsis retrotransposon Orf1 C-terminal domain-containing protein n=1 Tax=Brassica oleracea var. oleracea TaxID=109376 RepID=A0A0D3AXF2_BRAOL